MQISRSNKTVNLLIGLIFIVLLSSCYENVEGCLDPNSSNYDVTSDIACDDCCTYPTLSINVGIFNADTSYNNVDTIDNNLGQEFVIEDLQTYLSGFSVSDGNENYGIAETLNYVDANGNEQALIDDIILAKPNQIKYPLGTFIESNDYSSIMLTLGVPEEIDNASSLEIDSDHPLAIAGDSLYLASQNQYVKSWVVIRQIGVHEVADTLQINTSRHEYLFDELELNQERGSSLDLNIKIDYAELISEIDYNTMTQSEIIQQIGSNLSLVIQPNYE